MSELVSQFPALPKFHLSCRGLKLNIIQEKVTKSVFGQLKAAIRGNDDEESSGGKRWIVVKRSTPFSAEKQEKPMNTFAFTEIYQSESFEGLQSVNGIYPNLVATIPACAAGEDINLFVSVWIESSAVNSGKQSTLASCFVSVRQVYKGAMEGGLITPDDLSKIHHYTHIMHMKSEYCKDPFMALNVITLATDITLQSSSCVRPYAPARTPPPLHAPDVTPGEKAIEKPDKALVAASMPNPLQQQYVFFNPKENMATPTIFVDERVYEPRIVTSLPIMFLDNACKSLSSSLRSWRQRLVLEKTRQGFFNTSADAFKCGWYELSVEVVSATMTETDAYARNRLVTAKRPFVYHNPRTTSNSSNCSSGSSGGTHTEGGDDTHTQAATRQISSDRNRASSTATKKVPSHVDYAENVCAKIEVLPKKVHLADQSRPSTYADILVQDPLESFSCHLGRTNTEYHSFQPIFGSNLHSDCAPAHARGQMSTRAVTAGDISDANKSMLSHSDSTKLIEEDRDTVFDTFLVSEAVSINPADGKKEKEPFLQSVARAEQEQNPAIDHTTVHGKRSVFRRFIPRKKGVTVGVRLNSVDLGPKTGSSSSSSSGADGAGEAGEIGGGGGAGGKAGSSNSKGKAAAKSATLLLPSTSVDKDCRDSVLGIGSVPLDDLTLGVWQDYSLPMKLPADQERAGKADESVRDSVVTFRVRLDGPMPHQIDPESRAPSAMPYSLSYDRSRTGTREHLNETSRAMMQPYLRAPPAWQAVGISEGDPEHVMSTEESLGDSYAWLWAVGFLGRDPLAVDTESVRSGGLALRPRADVPYPIHWLQEYIDSLEELQMSLLESIDSLRTLDNTTFRSSALKTESEVQPLPINLHCQLVSIRRFPGAPDPDMSPGQVRERQCPPSRGQDSTVLESITCGSFSAHALGHKQGGLHSMKVDLLTMSNRLESLKGDLLQRLGLDGPGSGSVGLTEDMVEAGEKARPSVATGLMPWSIEGRLLSDIRTAVLAFEEHMLPVARRRLLSIAQILATAATALLCKLAMVEEGVLPQAAALQWLRHGLLIVFECLLSMKGKERGMIEDTIGAVDALRDFSFRLVCSDSIPGMESGEGDSSRLSLEGREIVVHLPPAAWASLPAEYHDENSRNEEEGHSGVIIRIHPVLFTQGLDMSQSMATMTGETAKEKTTTISGASLMNSTDLQHHVNISGLREMSKYCHMVRPLKPGEMSMALQAMAAQAKLSNGAAAGEAEDGGGVSVNLKQSAGGGSSSTMEETGISSSSDEMAHMLTAARDACVFVEPETKPSANDANPARAGNVNTQVHPLVLHLEQVLRYTDKTAKNVNLLMEVERVCHVVTGSRVTFCKSGKDRTGMVITLEQSRIFGERFDCGDDQERMVHDAHTMRLHGPRLDICRKNIGKPVYSINKLQAQFLPSVLRPPPTAMEKMIKGFKSSDNS